MAREKTVTWKLEDSEGKKCGCVVDHLRYHKMCAVHEAEFKEIHDRWTADKIRTDKEREEKETLKKTP